jgi:hypothetical protein
VAELEQKIKDLEFKSLRTLSVDDDGRSARDMTRCLRAEDGRDEGFLPAAQLASTLSVFTQMLKETSQGHASNVQEQESHEPERQVPITQTNGTILMTPPTSKAKSEKVRGFTYKNILSASAVESAGDDNFSAAKQEWVRLANDAPIFEADARIMVTYAFTKTVAAEYEDFCSKNQEADTEELWTLLEAKLYNSAQGSAARVAFNSANMRRGETIQGYVLRQKGLSRGLPECGIEEFVKQRFVSSNTTSKWKDAA